MKVPVVGLLMVTLPPPALVAGAVKVSGPPTESRAEAKPLTAPLATLGVRATGLPLATGVPGSTGTVTTWVMVRPPLLIVTVKVSVVLTPALCR